MKNITIKLLILLVITSCAVKKNNSEKFSLEINTKKGIFRTHNWVILYVNFINNSNEDVIILKPATKYGDQIDFLIHLSNVKIRLW